jgi:hypothetical protein
MSGGQLSYSEILRNNAQHESTNGAPDARPTAIPIQQSWMRSSHPAEGQTTVIPAAQPGGHQMVAGHDAWDGQVRAHIVVVLVLIALTSNASHSSLSLVKMAGKVMLHHLYHPPLHPVYLLGKMFLLHLGHETYHLCKNHKTKVVIRPLVFKQQKDKGESSNLWSLRLTYPALIKLTPPLPSSHLLSPLPILRHFQTNQESLCLHCSLILAQL